MRDVSDEGVNGEGGEGVVYVDGCGRGGAQRKGVSFRSSVWRRGLEEEEEGGRSVLCFFSLLFGVLYIYI